MLRQNAQHRLLSRIVLYSAVIALVWIMEKVGEAQKATPSDESPAHELVAFQSSD